jgi:hypothetical protein
LVTEKIHGYPESFILKVEDKCFNLLIGNFSYLHHGLISFLESGPLPVRFLDDLNDFMLREVSMLAFVQATYAICRLSEMIWACLLFALVEDLLSFLA